MVRRIKVFAFMLLFLAAALSGCKLPVPAAAVVSSAPQADSPAPYPSLAPSPTLSATPAPAVTPKGLYKDASGKTIFETGAVKVMLDVPQGWTPFEGPASMPMLGIDSPKKDVFIMVFALPMAAFGIQTDRSISWKEYVTEERIDKAFANILKDTKVEKRGWVDIQGISSYYRIMNGKPIASFISDKAAKKVMYIIPAKEYLACVYYEATPAAYKKYKDKEIKSILDSLSIGTLENPDLHLPLITEKAAACLDAVRYTFADPSTVHLDEAFYGMDGYDAFVDLHLTVQGESMIVRFVFDQTARSKLDSKYEIYKNESTSFYGFNVTQVPFILSQEKKALVLDIDQVNAKAGPVRAK